MLSKDAHILVSSSLCSYTSLQLISHERALLPILLPLSLLAPSWRRQDCTQEKGEKITPEVCPMNAGHREQLLSVTTLQGTSEGSRQISITGSPQTMCPHPYCNMKHSMVTSQPFSPGPCLLLYTSLCQWTHWTKGVEVHGHHIKGSSWLPGRLLSCKPNSLPRVFRPVTSKVCLHCQRVFDILKPS